MVVEVFFQIFWSNKDIILMSEYSYMFKSIIVGSSNTGKSCILTQLIYHTFNSPGKPTVGVEFGSKTLKIDADTIRLIIWDTSQAGQEIYQSITRSYYKGTTAAVLVYDITNRQSFESIPTWLQNIRCFSSKNATVILVGNKVDLQDSREVSKQEGQEFARLNGLLFLQATAKDSTLSIFEMLAKEVLTKIRKMELDLSDARLGIKVGTKDRIYLTNKKGRCC